jgi:AraC family transcriptional regulator
MASPPQRQERQVRSYEDRLLRVLDHIHDNPAGDLSLDALADVAAMSRFHWHRVFHAMTGETAAQAVRRIRLHRAAVWLVQTDMDLGEIAKRAGYASARSLARAFALQYGCSPSAFRKDGEMLAERLRNEKGETPVFPVEIADQPPRRLAAVAHSGPYPEIGGAFEKLSAIISARGLWPAVRGGVAVYYDDPAATEPRALRSHAGFVLDEAAAMPAGLDEVRIARGPAAVLHFRGPYAGLEAAYGYLYGTWLAQSGREPADAPVYEVYLNGPSDVPPEELLTEIVVPLK